MMMKQVNVVNYAGEVLGVVEVREVPVCLCGKEMYILQSSNGYDREWRCEDGCMGELIHRCVCCGDWVYEDVCCPEDFDDTLGFTLFCGHRHCMEEQAKELRRKQKEEARKKYFWQLKDATKYVQTYHVINAHTMTDIYLAIKGELGSDEFYLRYVGLASDKTSLEYHIISKDEVIGTVYFDESGLFDYQRVLLFPHKLRETMGRTVKVYI